MREKITANTPIADIEALFDKYFEAAVLSASNRMTQITDDVGYGTGDEWAPIDAMLNSNPRAKELFMNAMKNAIGYDNFSSLFKAMRDQKKSGATKQKTSTLVK